MLNKKYFIISFIALSFISCSKKIPQEIKMKAYAFCQNRAGIDSIKKKNKIYSVTCLDKSFQSIEKSKSLTLFKKGECIQFPSRVPFLNKDKLRFTTIASPKLKILEVNKKYYKVKVMQIKKEQEILISDLSNQWKVKKCLNK